MKTKFNGILTLLLALVVQISFAQEKTVSGTVTDDSGSLPGVSVIIKGTATGTETDFDGKYSIKAKTGDVLSFSYLGYVTIQKTVGSSNSINVKLEEDANVLDEVIVTAQGIRREKKALGFSVTTIKAELIERKPETDIAKLLNGKVAGVQINATGGFLGSGTNVIIRSKNSITGSNQPLYIVDGAPINGDRSFDLDPNNIANMSVLKGLAASTLYGEEGRNGVILITTKTGLGKNTNDKFEVTISQNSSFLEVSNLPEFQNIYGQGSDNNINTTFFGTWGARFDNQTVPHHLSIAAYNDVFPAFVGATTTYQAIPNNVSDFFNTGFGTNTSLNISKGGENSSFSLAVNHSDQVGYVKENTLKKFSLSVGGKAKLSNKLTFNSSLNYYKTTDNRPSRNLFQLLTWIPRNLDIHNLPYQNPNDGSSVYYRTTITNPIWTQKNDQLFTENNRIFMKADVTYQINDNFNLGYLFSLDLFHEFNKNHQNKGAAGGGIGSLTSFYRQSQVSTHRFSFSGNRIKLSEDFSLNAVAGLELKNNTSTFKGTASTGQVVYGFLKHNNFSSHTPLDSESIENRIGLYGSFDFDYKNYLFLNVSGRNDWASTTEKENNTALYPSVSMSFIPSTAFGDLFKNGDYLKVRASYGTSANFPNPYLTRPTLNSDAAAYINPFTGGLVATNSVSAFKPNPNLKAELLSEVEIGFEGAFLNKRVTFDISLYNKIVKDQILSSQLPNSTGFSSTVINAGRLDTKGLEVGLIFTPIKTDDFTWEINNNFTAYESTVKELPVDLINIASGLNYAIEGEAYGVIRGSYNVKDDEGNLLIDASNGKTLSSDNVAGFENKIIGDPNEDFSFSTINSFSYKGFTLSAQIEYTHGGDIWSQSASNLIRRGVTRDTESREGSFIIPGVLATDEGVLIRDANGQKIKNNIQIGANDLYFINLQDVDENIVFDATTLRLRDVSFSYALSDEALEKTPIGSLIFTVSANNLWYYTPNLPKYMNLDPEVLSSGVGNGRGLDFQNDPSYRQYSFGVKLTF